MRVHICAVGRARKGPEAVLVDDYLTRFGRTGRGVGFVAGTLLEVEDRKGGGAAEEAARLERAVPAEALCCALDERGTTMTSPEFARLLERWRDGGYRDAAFLIGGADGLTAELRARAEFRLSFGPMVWPHMLARVMLAEQLYRAAAILAGTPYHRE